MKNNLIIGSKYLASLPAVSGPHDDILSNIVSGWVQINKLGHVLIKVKNEASTNLRDSTWVKLMNCILGLFTSVSPQLRKLVRR